MSDALYPMMWNHDLHEAECAVVRGELQGIGAVQCVNGLRVYLAARNQQWEKSTGLKIVLSRRGRRTLGDFVELVVRLADLVRARADQVVYPYLGCA